MITPQIRKLSLTKETLSNLAMKGTPGQADPERLCSDGSYASTCPCSK